MPRSRTIVTLGALLGAMTTGTFALLALETTPARPSAIAALAAVQTPSPLERSVAQAIAHTDLPVQAGKWTSIVVHDCAGGMRGLCAAGSHFYVDTAADASGDGPLYPTLRWAEQAPGQHAFVPDERFNAGAIGICLAGDLAATAPTAAQMEALVALVGALQRRLDIPAERVYLHGDLTGLSCPGPRFPVEAFRRSLR